MMPDEKPESGPVSPEHVQQRIESKQTEEGLTSSGQRKVNLIWECTQSAIALSVVGANLIVGVSVGLGFSQADIPSTLTNAVFLVIGFYFSRTNHAAIGGVGPKPPYQKYEGR